MPKSLRVILLLLFPVLVFAQTPKTDSQLTTELENLIPNNTQKLITPANVRTVIQDGWNARISIYGNSKILGKFTYNSLFPITNDGDLIYKAYLEQRLSEISVDTTGDTTTTTKVTKWNGRYGDVYLDSSDFIGLGKTYPYWSNPLGFLRTINPATIHAMFSNGTGLNYNSSTGQFSFTGTTNNVPEGSNLYFTSARVKALFSSSPTIIFNSVAGSFNLNGLSVLGTAGQQIRMNASATGFEYFTPATGVTTSQAIELNGPDVTGAGTIATGISATISANAVTTSKINNGAVTLTKINATGTPSNSTWLNGLGAWRQIQFSDLSSLPSTTTEYGITDAEILANKAIDMGVVNNTKYPTIQLMKAQDDLKQNVISIPSNSLMGRYSTGSGSFQTITLSSDFSIVGGVLVSTGSTGGGTLPDTFQLVVSSPLYFTQGTPDIVYAEDGVTVLLSEEGDTLYSENASTGRYIGIRNASLSSQGVARLSQTTIAGLRTLESPDVNTHYYTQDIGKEGYWKYDPSDVSSTDNLGLILVSGTGKRYKRIITKNIILPGWFGVMPDDGVNDGAALNAMTKVLPYNTYVALSGGTYNIEQTWKLKDSMTVDGFGIAKLRLNNNVINNSLYGDSADGNVIAVGYVGAPTSYHVTIQGVIINGNYRGQNLSGVGLKHGGYGIFLRTTDQVTVRDCDVFDCVQTGVYAYNANNLLWDHVYSHHNGYGGIANSGKNNFDLQGSNATDSYGYGRDNKMINCKSDSAFDSGLGFSGTTNFIISNCHFNNNPVGAIEGISNNLTTNKNVARNMIISNVWITGGGNGISVNCQSEETVELNNVHFKDLGNAILIVEQKRGGRLLMNGVTANNWKQTSTVSFVHALTLQCEDIQMSDCSFKMDSGKTALSGQFISVLGNKRFKVGNSYFINIPGRFDVSQNSLPRQSTDFFEFYGNLYNSGSQIRIYKDDPTLFFKNVSIHHNKFTPARNSGTMPGYIEFFNTDTIENVSIYKNESWDSSATKRAVNAVVFNSGSIIKNFLHIDNDWRDLSSNAENIIAGAVIVNRNVPYAVPTYDKHSKLVTDSAFVFRSRFVGINQYNPQYILHLGGQWVQRCKNGYGIAFEMNQGFQATANGDTIIHFRNNMRTVDLNGKTGVNVYLEAQKYGGKNRRLVNQYGSHSLYFGTSLGKNAGRIDMSGGGNNAPQFVMFDSLGVSRTQINSVIGGKMEFRVSSTGSASNPWLTIFNNGHVVRQSTNSSATDLYPSGGPAFQNYGGLWENDSLVINSVTGNRLAFFSPTKALRSVKFSSGFSIVNDTLKYNGTISNNSVTYSQFQKVGANRLLGNATGSTANVAEVPIGSTMSFSSGSLTVNPIFLATPTTSGTVLDWTNGSVAPAGTATLRIPMASTPTVGAGLLSNFDYNLIFNVVNSAITGFGTFGNTPDNKGVTVAGNTATLQPADADHPGGLSTTAQTIPGEKTMAQPLTVPLHGVTTNDPALIFGNPNFHIRVDGPGNNTGSNNMYFVSDATGAGKAIRINGDNLYANNVNTSTLIANFIRPKALQIDNFTILSNHTLDDTESFLLVDAAGGNITIAIPDSYIGNFIMIKKIDSSANTVTIDPEGTTTVEFVATKVLSTRGETVIMTKNIDGWYIIN